MAKRETMKSQALFGKSVIAEIRRPISKKEVDDVLREWAVARIIGRRACACIPKVSGNAVLVMPEKEYKEYTEAVTLAGFCDYAWNSNAETESIMGMPVVIDEQAKRIVVRPNDLPNTKQHKEHSNGKA